jgi:hypothetical protein
VSNQTRCLPYETSSGAARGTWPSDARSRRSVIAALPSEPRLRVVPNSPLMDVRAVGEKQARDLDAVARDGPAESRDAAGHEVQEEVGSLQFWEAVENGRSAGRRGKRDVNTVVADVVKALKMAGSSAFSH